MRDVLEDLFFSISIKWRGGSDKGIEYRSQGPDIGALVVAVVVLQDIRRYIISLN